MTNDQGQVNRDDRATRVRYSVVGLTTAMAVLLYLDRYCTSMLLVYIREDLGIDIERAGLLISAFFWGYALGQVPAGWLSDRFGARHMLALYILTWSLLTGLLGTAQSFWPAVLLLFGCGLAQAGAYPTAAGIVSKWVPFASRGRASGVISTGGRVGGVASQLLTAYLLVTFVPLSVPSLLTAEDLLDVNGLIEQLDPAKLAKKPSTSVERAAEELSLTIRPMLSGKAERPVPKDQASLLAALNGVLKRRDLYSKVKLEDFPLSNEALRLAKVPGDKLRLEDIERRNRLLLEAAYSKYIRKIQGLGWRPTLWVYGLAGLVVATSFWWVVRNRPEEQPRVNELELQIISEGLPAVCAVPHGQVQAIPWGPLLRSGNMWFSSISQFFTNFSWAFLLQLLPTYLDEEHHVPVLERGWLAGLPILVGMFGMLAGGWLTDRMARALGLRWGRRLPLVATRFLAMAGYLCVPFLPSAPLATIAFCVVAIGTDLGTASLWAFNQDVGGKHVGSVLGWGNMWGAVGAALSPVVVMWVKVNGDMGWQPCFAVLAAGFLFSGLAGLGIDATVRLETADKDDL